MGTVSPMYSTDFEVIPRGTYLLEVKEAGIENTNPKDGGQVRRRYWLRLAVVGGECEGMTHLESFFSDTKDDFSFRRMFGFLQKLGVIPMDMKTIDTKVFGTDKFEDRFRRGTKGMRMGGKVSWRYKDNDKDRENPQSELRTFYSEAEVLSLIAKRGEPTATSAAARQVDAPTVDEWGRPLNPPTSTVTATAPITTLPVEDKPKAPWS